MRMLIVGVLMGCGSGAEESGKGPKGDDADAAVDPVTVVEAASVAKGSVADVLTSSAVVESEASADLVPEATGVVREIRKDEGDPVEKGDVLAVLDNVTLGTGAARASAEVSRLEQQVDEAKSLLQRGAISVREVEDLEHQLRTARLSSREASSSYGSTRLTAPFDGVVAMRDVRVGELATSAKPAFQVVDPRRLRVVASLPERDLARVALGQPTRLISAYDDEIWTTGEVSRLSPVVDAASGTFRATIGVPDPGKLRPGQFVSVKIEVDRHAEVLVVPKEALVYEDGLPVLYRIVPAPEEEDDDEDAEEGDDGGGGGWWPFGGGGDEEDEESAEEEEEAGERLVAERVNVTLGLVDDDWAEVSAGVELGQRVITVGQSHLRDGGRIRVVDDEDDSQEASGAGAVKPDATEGDEG
ncbi:MAG: efflux RND transporter periplasmic adaptor subunit [Myxococcales bacterium]|nr:efflux RND transporter periplasmic adaptor subunit [Myxococcales bacterium]